MVGNNNSYDKIALYLFTKRRPKTYKSCTIIRARRKNNFSSNPTIDWHCNCAARIFIITFHSILISVRPSGENRGRWGRGSRPIAPETDISIDIYIYIGFDVRSMTGRRPRRRRRVLAESGLRVVSIPPKTYRGRHGGGTQWRDGGATIIIRFQMCQPFDVARRRRSVSCVRSLPACGPAAHPSRPRND